MPAVAWDFSAWAISIQIHDSGDTAAALNLNKHDIARAPGKKRTIGTVTSASRSFRSVLSGNEILDILRTKWCAYYSIVAASDTSGLPEMSVKRNQCPLSD